MGGPDGGCDGRASRQPPAGRWRRAAAGSGGLGRVVRGALEEQGAKAAERDPDP